MGRREELHEFGTAVAAALGPRWLYAAVDDAHVGELVDGDGRKVGLFWPGGTSKVSVSGHYPRHPRLGWGPWHGPRVNVGAHRRPAVVARDLQRRFLPEFVAAWDGWVADCAEYDRSDEFTAALASELGATIGAVPRKRDEHHEVGFFDDGYAVSFELSAHGGITLAIRGLADGTARRIAQVIGEDRRQRERERRAAADDGIIRQPA